LRKGKKRRAVRAKRRKWALKRRLSPVRRKRRKPEAKILSAHWTYAVLKSPDKMGLR
jgi:hypothetical protein